MKVLWTIVKVALGLALIIPLGIVVLATAMGILGTLFGLAVFVLRIAVVGLIAFGAFKLLSSLLGWGTPRRAEAPVVRELLPPRDPHYEAAMRELDRELGTSR
jgi:hypothetical protein